MMSESIRDGYKMTELGELPEGWVVEKIGDVLTLKGGSTPSTNDNEYWNGQIPWAVPTDITKLKSKFIIDTERKITNKGLLNCSATLLPVGNILLTSRATIGFLAINKIEMATNQGFINIIPPNDLSKLYLYYYLDFIKNKFVLQASGSTFLELSKSTFRKFSIPLPPLPEQHRIAEILSIIDETIERTEALIEKYRHIKAGLMSDLLTRGIDEEGRIRSEETHEFKDSPLGRVPEGWVVEKLEKMSEFLDNKRVPIKKNDRGKMKGNIPYYGASSIIDWINNFVFNETLILLGEDGENLISRNLPLAFKITGKSWVNNHAHVIRPNKDVNIDYLTTYLENIDYKNFISGSAQPKLNQQACLNIFIKKPELLEQHHIAEILTTTDTYIEKEQTYLNKLQQIKKGLMQDLLTGKVRITTAPSPPKPSEAAT